MRLTREADYGVQLLLMLGEGRERSVTARPAIAGRLGISPDFAAKILRKLGRAGLVRSFAGAHGGYTLARAPSRIDLASVIEAIDGPIEMARCGNSGRGPCLMDRGCTGRAGLERVQDDVRRLLAGYALSDLGGLAGARTSGRTRKGRGGRRAARDRGLAAPRAAGSLAARAALNAETS